MKTISYVAVFIALFLCCYVIFLTEFYKHQPVGYDCRMLIGGWHPDVPKQVINECRKERIKV
jgi:hypothetical protein